MEILQISDQDADDADNFDNLLASTRGAFRRRQGDDGTQGRYPMVIRDSESELKRCPCT